MSKGGGATILVADDDEDVRGTIAEYLRAHGFEVAEAVDGFDALLQIKRVRPRAVVLDLVMPRLGGLEALKQIRESSPETTVVVVTGLVDPGVHEQALAAGASTVLTKPVDLAALRAALSAPPAPRRALAHAPGSGPRAQATAAGRVLIVDDDADVRAVLEEFLVAHGYVTRSVGDATGAFWAVIQDVPDVVLLDILLPGFNGVEFIPTIRFAGKDVKIIMVSGISDVGLAKRALAQGAFDYIRKPVDMAYLLRSLEAAMSVRRL